MVIVGYSIEDGQCVIKCMDNDILGETETSLCHERCLWFI